VKKKKKKIRIVVHSLFFLSLSAVRSSCPERILSALDQKEESRRIQQIQVEKKRASPFTTVVEAVAVEEQQSERAQSIYNTSSTLYLSLSLSALLSSPCL
jgi:hypothetical protein